MSDGRGTTCPVCGAGARSMLVALPGVPLDANALYPTREEALAAPRGDVELASCSRCGSIWNAAFDAAKLEYGADYENSLHFSPAFQRYAVELADRLIERYGVRGRTVLEIGSGKGEFLTLLCARGDNRGVGVDPSYAGESDSGAEGRIRFVRALYTEETATEPADLVVCRHVLEHLEDPVAILRAIRRGARDDTVAYLEVPSGDYLLREQAVWDVIYPHYSIFTAGSLRIAVERAGFEVLDLGVSFGGQYLWIEATPAPAGRDADGGGGSDAPPHPHAESFARAVADKRAFWARELAGGVAGRSALWGAGAKGTTFLNLVEGAAAIPVAVDVNPRKRGTYVPGTGQRIVAPDELAQSPPERVIVMNPIYRDEISAALHALGLSPRVDAV